MSLGFNDLCLLAVVWLLCGRSLCWVAFLLIRYSNNKAPAIFKPSVAQVKSAMTSLSTTVTIAIRLQSQEVSKIRRLVC